jgi:dnd system-associated protein 4
MRTFRASEKYRGLIEKLTQSNHSVAGKSIFPTMRDLLCFAAVLGFEYDHHAELAGKSFEIVDGRVFSNSQQAIDLLYLVSLASSKDPEILRDENEEKMIDIFERYAQGGFEIIDGWLSEKPEDLNGDKAILAALSKNKFLDAPRDSEDATRDVSF